MALSMAASGSHGGAEGDAAMTEEVESFLVHVAGGVEALVSAEERERNEQEQEYEVEALKAIYADDFRLLKQPADYPLVFAVSVHIEVLDPLQIVTRLSSSSSSSSSLNPSSDDPPSKTPNEVPNLNTEANLTSVSAETSPPESMLPQELRSVTVKHLPPMHLLCVLPSDYPSHSPPRFQLSCFWLSHEIIVKLCERLQRLWEEQGEGQVIVFTWVDWLSRECLTFLKIGNDLELGPYVENRPNFVEKNQGFRAVSEMKSFEEDVVKLMRWNKSEEEECFMRELHTCLICFSEFQGSEFVRIPCGHNFCRGCMHTFAECHVAEGSIAKIVCPDTSCRGALPPGLLRELLPEAAFSRWDALTLQRSLDAMADLSYCPRCSAPCVEDGDSCAQCANCYFVFCGLCRATWHAGRPCLDAETRRKVLMERAAGRSGEEEVRRFRAALAEAESESYVAREARRCPACGAAISKTEGCNKMCCANCSAYFCYRCGKGIQGYDHFRDGECELFDLDDVARWERAMQQQHGMQPAARPPPAGADPGGGAPWLERRRLCPLCRQENHKAGRNNHMQCWACRNHFCALCGRVVRSSADHYGPARCRQHTA